MRATVFLVGMLLSGCAASTAEIRLRALEQRVAESPKLCRVDESTWVRCDAQRQLGGEEPHSAPIAARGAFIPLERASRYSLLGGLPALPVAAGPQSFTGSKTFTSQSGVASNIKWCFDGPTTCTRYVQYNSTDNRVYFVGTASEYFSFNRNVEFLSTAQFYSTVILTGGSAALQLGTSGTPISDSYAAASASIDFASITTTTADSSGITVTGAAVGDTCEVGPPTAAMVTGSAFTCYVSATDTVVVRHQAAGTANPGAGVFNVRVFDP